MNSEEQESPYFPGTPEGTPPNIQIQRAKELENKSPSFPGTPEGTPPNIQIQRAKEMENESSKSKTNPKKDMEAMVEFYLADNPHIFNSRKTGELEIRFGTNPKSGKPMSKIDYDNVVQAFYAAGFSTENTEGLSILRIQNEDFLDKKTGQYKMSNIRSEVMGIDLIQEYCRSNNLQKVIDLPSTVSAVADKIKFTQKQPPYIGKDRETSKPLKAVDFTDFNFRVSYQYEKDFYPHSEVAKRILTNWLDSKKTFRYINRVRLRHPEYPVFLDVSMIKGSPTKKVRDKDIPIPMYTVQEANVFHNNITYEVELEVDNTRIGPGTDYNNSLKLLDVLRKNIRLVLTGLQGTNYPISNSEKEKVLFSYADLILDENAAREFKENYNSPQKYVRENARKKLPKHFIGPSSNTLQIKHVVPLPESSKDQISTIPNIRENYTVTDKADGDRKLLYVASNGHMYMIDTNMNIIFTGMMTQNKDLYNSILDGEHIKYDKNNKFVNLYAAFDIYYIDGKSVRELNFVPMQEDDVPEEFRLIRLQNYIKELKAKSILDKDSGNSNPTKQHGKVDNESHSCYLTIKCKHFESSREKDIFIACSNILSKVKDGSYEYNTDGLIFTPTTTGVGGSRSKHTGPLSKFTWDQSFKWKPPEYNTIDFLVSVKKDKTGKDEIHNVYQEGLSMNNVDNILQYKTLILRCGFSNKDHGYINPMLDMINDTLPSNTDRDNYQKYQPVQFQPTNPYDLDAGLCNVVLHGSNLAMMTEENEYFEEDMIVEFSYNVNKKGNWRWSPLRVRYDKTNDLRAGGTNYGNAYHVANSNWHSIHNPVTEDMITTGQNIPDDIGDEDVYYNRTGQDTTTRSLRDFHNSYVKRKLILGVSNRDDILIDYAVGQGGDFPKWIAAKLKFVFGIDVSKDNIENKKNGACARYLNYKKDYKVMPDALFAHGNSGLNIRNGKALVSERDKQISSAIFGNGGKDKEELGDGVYKQFGIGKEGFHISSCQFALHYFFENEKSLHSFLRNLSECTRVNGYFIGTCYDGETVFNVLRNKNKGESMAIYRDQVKIFEITKQYNDTGFPEDETSLNYGIDVYQESINKVFREYLVNFNYLERVLENYGFSLITKEEAEGMGLPQGSGLFDDLFNTMNVELERNFKNKKEYRSAPNMTKEEKKISFMNRYFVFRKTHNVNAEKVYKLLVTKDKLPDEEEDAEKIIEEVAKEDEKIKNTMQDVKQPVTIRKLPGKKRKLVIGDNQYPKTEDVGTTELALQEPKKVVIIRKPKKKE